MTTQNFGRLPIIDQTIGISYSVDKDPFGTDEEVSGYYVVCHDPRHQFPQIVGGAHDTPEQASAALREIAGE